ncbi:DUF342 domain-containing protein [Clostridium amazonitimonense]|uniref:DUF342 domain-containing protein n=1 Tax=Clostridium amazonitimonense TaxID=1499689 RepID=UPI0005098477|nr:flagellar assembly protein A [Clostridium amazonitimonense]
MVGKVYSASTLEKCLFQASKDLNIPQGDLIYTIIEEKKGLFSKKVVIKVTVKEKDKEPEQIEDKDGIIGIKDGKIYVLDPKEGGRPAKITPSEKVVIKVDGEEIKEEKFVLSSSNIEVTIPEDDTVPKRILDIKIFPDKMKAYGSTEFVPKKIYSLKDTIDKKILNIELKEENVYSPLYTYEEVKAALEKSGIVFGIKEEEIDKLINEKNQNNILLAEGLLPVDEEQDYIDFKYGQDINKFKEDKRGRIDYKSIGAVQAFKKGDVIAEKIKGKPGMEGKSVKGDTLSYKPAKPIVFRAADGCKLSDEGDKIISTIEGKPTFKNGTFYVKPVHEVLSDVDLKTGNIKFSGDIVIKGNVKEGMKIEGGSSVLIEGAIESSEIIGKGDIDIKGNILLSRVYGGGNDVLKLQYLNDLNTLLNALESMMTSVMEIKRFNLVNKDVADGEIIKALIDNKFKTLPKICANILRDSMLEDDINTEVVDILKEKIIGFGPLKIKHFSEIDDIISIVKRKIEILNNNLTLPVNVTLNYCQDSNIQSSGNIFFKGKGEYISNISSNNGVYFEEPGSIARGGTIKAKNEIRAKTVGSSGGVSTRLAVESKGHIYVEVAYQNTIFAFGEKESVLDVPSKDVHAYVDEDGDIIIDRLKL